MTKRIYAALVSFAAAFVAVAFAQSVGASPPCDGHHCQHHAARGARQRVRVARQRARARRRGDRRAVSYVCPMHADVRERSRGACPKCLMDLVAEPRGAKARGSKVNAGGGAGAHATRGARGGER